MRRRKLSRALKYEQMCARQLGAGCEERIAFQTETQSGKLQAQENDLAWLAIE